MMVTKNPQNVHRKYFWAILMTFIWHQNWRQYVWTSLCLFFLWTSSIVQMFDYLHLTSFWQLDIFLTTWHLFEILGANCPWAPLPICPYPCTPLPTYPIAHVTHCWCGPYPLYPIPPVPLLPMCPIPLYPIPPVPPLPIGPMAYTPVPHTPCTLLPHLFDILTHLT